MAHPKRLFLFAGYNKDNSLDESLVYYVKNLSKFGDIILCMDNDCKKSELAKVKPFVIHALATRHSEYDFGSYKRAYQYARDKKLLKNYNHIYLVNDSVFGPLIDMTDTITKMEQTNADATGLIVATHETHSYMESWFVRLNKKIFNSKWFNEFISGVEKQPTKARVTIKYEHGLSNLIHEHKLSWNGVYVYHGRYTYNNPKRLLKNGCPFIKKACFTRHNGALGNQIRYILNHSPMQISLAIITSANKTYGQQYMDWFLTNNPFKIFIRKFSYALKKIKNGKI